MWFRLSVVTSLMGLCACAVGPNFKSPAPPTAANYGGASLQRETAASDGDGGTSQRFVESMSIPADWWTLYQSPSLTRLVEQALKGNPNVAAAEAALRQSHELFVAQRASYLPSIHAGFSAMRSKYATEALANPTVAPNPVYNLFTGQLNLSYAPDLFGGTRRTVEAARANVEFNRFQLEATYLTLSSNVVVTAVQEASLRGQIAATERVLELQHQLSMTVRGQLELGTASNLDFLAQQAAELQTAATLAPLRKQLGQTRDELTALLGRLPSEEPAETFGLQELKLPSDLPVSLPSQLVAQRPDVRQAEENMHVASAGVGIALANMLPQFAITADTGSDTLTLGNMFGPYSGFWDLGASLTQTLFDAGALRHRRRAADAALDQAAAQYRAAVILACQNVADTLRALQADADALKASAESERAAKATLDTARHQQELGTISFVAVWNAEQNYLQAELILVQAQASRYADTAGLFQALGGGWWNRAPGGAK
jgi:NodT family efflux transporter outer membrane factor (OMF) lipoprotein